MKKSFLLTGGFMITLGVFMALGTVLPAKPALALQAGSASTAEVLQPAEEVVYNEELRVNGTGRFNSVYIGQQGIGGVTFFNGTIVNSTTNNGGDNPVTFGDGVRIDGEIWRTEKGGDNPLKISDHVMPTLHNMNDMGIEGTAWRNMYYADTLHGGSADLSGDLDVNGVATIGDNLVVVGTATFGGGYGNSGITLHSNGDLEMDADLTVDGDIDQDINNGGAVKAVVYITTTAAPSSTCTVERSWTLNNSTPTCSTASGSDGTYDIDFNFQVNDRFWQVTPLFTNIISAGTTTTNDEEIRVELNKRSDGTNAFSPFMLTVY